MYSVVSPDGLFVRVRRLLVIHGEEKLYFRIARWRASEPVAELRLRKRFGCDAGPFGCVSVVTFPIEDI